MSMKMQVVVWVATIALSLILYLAYFDNESSPIPELRNSPVAIAQLPDEEEQPASRSRGTRDSVAADTQDKTAARGTFEEASPDDQKNERLWRAERGYFFEGGRAYDVLTEHELRSLADSGDMFALQILAGRSSFSDPDTAIALYEEASVFGSTVALITMAELIRVHDTEGGKLSRFEDFDPGVEALTYAYAAVLRGDNISGGIKKREIIEHYGIGKSDAAKACERAKGLVSSLEQRRLELLGQTFDNSRSRFGVPERDSQLNCD